MPIQFNCPGCQKQLRVDDSAAGKKAKCPQCETVVVVPAAPATPEQAPPSKPDESPSGGGFPPMRDAGPVNPYASPETGQMHDKIAATGGPISRRPLDVGQVMSFAWKVWQDNLGLLVGGFVVIAILGGIVSAPFGFLQASFEQQGAVEASIAVSLVGNILSNLVSIYLQIGFAQLCLQMARGQRADFAQIFGGASRFLPVLGLSILMGLAIGLGLMLCIVPGILLALMWWPAYYLVVDEKADVMEAFTVAGQITKDNWGPAVALWFMSAGIMIFGLLALCIGVIFAAPLVTMMWVCAYLMISGQADYTPKPV